jgi:menaquinone-9 beta-reductase
MSADAFDVVVVGAGPAGSMAALRAVRLGVSVLLVDKQRFPRDKVCGCCVNGAAMAALRQAHLGDLPRRLGARPLTSAHVRAGARRVILPLRDSAVVSRVALDAALAAAAADAGAQFRDATAARVGAIDGFVRVVELPQGTVRARCVVMATGLAGEVATRGASRIGLGACIPAGGDYCPGEVHMACGAAGYVGLVVLESGLLDIAAAIDPRFVRTRGGAGEAVQAILRDCGMSIPAALADARWRGTPLLTRQRHRVADERLLFAGDAAGYVEPFTGEGIAWALACGWAAGAMAARRWEPRGGQAWTAKTVQLRRRQLTCRLVAAVLRRPRMTRVAIALLSAAPVLAAPVLQRMNRPILMDSPAPAP